jgi:beta-phosphoglucomutase
MLIVLKAVIFDFDGVIVDAEPVHLKAFQAVLKEEGIELSEKEYYDKYLALDDKTCFAGVLKDRGRNFDKSLIHDLTVRKSNYYDHFIRESLVIFPGVIDFVKRLYGKYPISIGSGALKHEIEFILESIGIRHEFSIIVSGDEIENCKPAPDVYIRVLQLINQLDSLKSETVYPYECLVIEDSIAGITAARSTGMKCLAITNSYPAEKLFEADMIVNSLEAVNIENIEKLF